MAKVYNQFSMAAAFSCCIVLGLKHKAESQHA